MWCWQNSPPTRPSGNAPRPGSRARPRMRAGGARGRFGSRRRDLPRGTNSKRLTEIGPSAGRPWCPPRLESDATTPPGSFGARRWYLIAGGRPGVRPAVAPPGRAGELAGVDPEVVPGDRTIVVPEGRGLREEADLRDRFAGIAIRAEEQPPVGSTDVAHVGGRRAADPGDPERSARRQGVLRGEREAVRAVAPGVVALAVRRVPRC